jgi:hypothetical protein
MLGNVVAVFRYKSLQWPLLTIILFSVIQVISGETDRGIWVVVLFLASANAAAGVGADTARFPFSSAYRYLLAASLIAASVFFAAGYLLMPINGAFKPVFLLSYAIVTAVTFVWAMIGRFRARPVA